jgi:hypothetical protein
LTAQPNRPRWGHKQTCRFGYRTTDNFIGGAVVTFTDVTPVTQAQEALRESESQSRLLLAELQHR